MGSETATIATDAAESGEQQADNYFIAEPLHSLIIPIDDAHLDPANARVGHAIDRIAASLKQYSQRRPIVVNRREGNKIEAGNGTWQAAKSLGWTHIAAVFVDDDPATAVGFAIADNRTGDMSHFDWGLLADLIGAIDPDEIYTGFNEEELERILGSAGALPTFKEFDESAAEEVEYNECPECGHRWPK